MTENQDQRAIVTVIGKDKVGIIAGVATALCDAGVNILDISQTTIQEFLTMFMVVDISKSKLDFSELQKKLDEVGDRVGVRITAQREDVFNFMHRI